MSIIPLIVGCVFFAFGFNIILNFMRFRNQGIKIKGNVKAIEKYTSITGTGSDRTRTTFYAPIVEYIYKDQIHTTTGIGTNEIRHKLQQNVTVLIIESKTDDTFQECLDEASNYFIGAIFALVGLVSLGVYLFMGGSWILTLIALPTVTGAGHIICALTRNMKGITQSSNTSTTKNEDSILIETKADYIKEISAHSFWGNIIAYGLMLLSIGIMYGGYVQLPAKAIEMLSTDFGLFWEKVTSGEIPSSWEAPLILFGIGLFFFLASLRSVYYVRKKYGSMMKL
ncbi:MAG: hypothetical protein COA45_06675 [Zetaproteobacteria bacterium]|nr:MAG: hypothetical protein COA45_06675 [Zetaproteobacteria bacterium]